MSRKIHVVYTIPMFSQECTGTYARFHDVIHTLQRMKDPPWDYTIVPLRRYYGDPSPNVLFQDGSAFFRLKNYLRNVVKASRNADIVHIVQGDVPYSLLVAMIVGKQMPVIVGPNVIRVGINVDWLRHTQGGLQTPYQEFLVQYGLTIHNWNRMVFHRNSPFSAYFDRILVFRGYYSLGLELGGMDPSKLEVIPSGVRPDIFRPDGEAIAFTSDFAILYVGDARRLYLKGFDVFVKALEALRDMGIRFHAHILGLTSARVEQLVQAHRLGSQTDLVGQVSRADMGSYYRGADVYVCPSRYEADSTTATEALACGIPVVGTNIPGIPKTTSFRLGDAEDLTEKLVSIYRDRDKNQQDFRESVSQWGIEAVIDKLNSVYSEYMDAGSSESG